MSLVVLIGAALAVLAAEGFMGRIWKKVNNDWRGYGNGFKAVIYTYPETEHVDVRVHKNDHLVEHKFLDTLEGAKRWAERNYLKGTK